METETPRPKYHRRTDLKRLQEAAIETPLIIGDDGRSYTVRFYAKAHPVLAGRHEVVFAYIRGYADALQRAAVAE
jgi:hypothetical protein